MLLSIIKIGSVLKYLNLSRIVRDYFDFDKEMVKCYNVSILSFPNTFEGIPLPCRMSKQEVSLSQSAYCTCLTFQASALMELQFFFGFHCGRKSLTCIVFQHQGPACLRLLDYDFSKKHPKALHMILLKGRTLLQ